MNKETKKTNRMETLAGESWIVSAIRFDLINQPAGKWQHETDHVTQTKKQSRSNSSEKATQFPRENCR